MASLSHKDVVYGICTRVLSEVTISTREDSPLPLAVPSTYTLGKKQPCKGVDKFVRVEWVGCKCEVREDCVQSVRNIFTSKNYTSYM